MSKIGYNAIGRGKLATDFRRADVNAGNVAVRNAMQAASARKAAAIARLVVACSVSAVVALVAFTIVL